MKKFLIPFLLGAVALFACAGVACGPVQSESSDSDSVLGSGSDEGADPVRETLDGEYILNDFESVADMYAMKPVDENLGLRGKFEISGEQKTSGQSSLKYTHTAGSEIKMNFYIAQTPYPEMDISALTEIGFDVFNGGSGEISVKLELSGAGVALTSVSETIPAGEWKDVLMETPLTLTRPNADTIDLISLTILAPETGTSAYYVDRFRATFDEDAFDVAAMTEKLNAMIEELPAAENITEADRAAVTEARSIYELFSEEEKAAVQQYDKLAACIDKLESLPYVFFNAGDPTVTERFAVVSSSEVGLEWTGSISTEKDADGKDWIKFHMETRGTQTAVYTPYSLSGIDLSAYDYIRLTVRGGGSQARFRIITEEWGASVTPWVWYDGDSEEGQDILLYTDEFVNDNWYIVVAGLPETGADVYLSSFVAYGYKYVQSLIDALPDPDTMTEADMPTVMEVYDTYLTLSEEAQANVNTERLTECRNAFVQPGDEAEIVAMIDALPDPEDVVYTDRTEIQKAMAAYNASLEKVQELVGDKYDKLEACMKALEGLPYLIYDASDPDVVKKFTIMTTSNVGLNWTGTIDTVNEGDENWIRFHMDQSGTQQAACVLYSLTDVDLTGYEYVYLHVKGGSSGIRFAIITQEWGSTVFSVFYDPAGEDIFIPVNLFASARENYFQLVIQNIENGQDVYFSDFTAYTVQNIQDMIDGLPDAASVTAGDKERIEKIRLLYDNLSDAGKESVDVTKLEACEEALSDASSEIAVISLIEDLPDAALLTPKDRKRVEEAKALYDALADDAKDKVTNIAKLEACLKKLEALPLLIYDAEDESVVNNFSVEETAAGGCEWTGTISTIQDEEGSWIKFHMETCGSQSGIYTPYSLSGVDLTNYDYVVFRIKGGGNEARFRIIREGFAAGVSPWVWYNRDGITEIVVPVSQFVSDAHPLFIMVAGLTAGTDIYMGSFYAYGAGTVQRMIDALPESDRVTESDLAAVEEAEKYYGYLSEEAKALVDTEKLDACLEKLKGPEG